MALDNLRKEDVSAEQLDALMDKKQGMDAGVIKMVTAQKRSIREQLLKDGAEGIFTKDEIEEKLARLDEVDETKVSGLRGLQMELTRQRQVISKLIQNFDSKLNSARKYFGKKGNWSALEEYKEEFRQQAFEGKKEWFNALDPDIAERKELFNKAEGKGISLDKISTLKRSELRSLLADVESSSSDIKGLENLLNKNSELFSDEEREEKIALMNDSTRYEQSRILRDTLGEIKSRSEVLDIYNELPSNYAGQIGDFNKLSFKKRENAIVKVDKQVVRDYRDKMRSHPLAMHISEDSKDLAYAYIKGCSVIEKIEALNQLEGAFKAEKKLFDEYENVLKRLDTEDDGARADKLKMSFLDSSYGEKVGLIKDLKKELKEGKAEVKKLEAEYGRLLKASVSAGDISKKTFVRALKHYSKFSLEEKQHYVENYDSIMSERIEMKESYQELADDMGILKVEQKEKFFSRGLIARRKELAKLKEQVEQSEKLEARYTVKLENALDNNYISEKTFDSFMKWFAEQDEKGMKDAIARFDRVMAPRIVILCDFESLIENLPKDIVAFEKARFEKEGLTGRKAILKKLENKYGRKEVGEDLNGVNDRVASEVGGDGGGVEMNDKDMNDLIDEIEGKKTVKDNRIVETTFKVLAEEMGISERKNHGSTVAAERTSDLLSADDKVIAKALNDYSDGDFVMEKDGTVTEVVDTGVESMYFVSKEGLGSLKEDAKHIQMESESDPTAKNIQFHDNSGKALKAESVLGRVDKMKAGTDAKMFKMASEIAKRRGQKLKKDAFKDILENTEDEIMLKNAA